jgi:hypothetical protein
MYNTLSPRSRYHLGPEMTRLRWKNRLLVTVTIGNKWIQPLDLHDGDQAMVITTYEQYPDSLLVVKAPFQGWCGSKVRIYSDRSSAHFTRTCTSQTIDFLFRLHNRQDIFPGDARIVTLEGNVTALALKVPEIEEYLRMKMIAGVTTPLLAGPAVEASPETMDEYWAYGEEDDPDSCKEDIGQTDRSMPVTDHVEQEYSVEYDESNVLPSV